jgi:anti-anti-sigma factor
MKLPTEIFGRVVVVHAPEELGRDQAPSVSEFIKALDQRQVILDLDTTEAVDSAGLEALLEIYDMLGSLGGELKIATKSHVNRKILEITRLDQHLEVFSNLVDAVKSFQ